MRRTSFYTVTVALLFLGIGMTACQKTDDGVVKLDTRLCVETRHHEWSVPNTTIYVKYGEDEYQFPGYEPLEYDTSFQADANGKLCLENISFGDYWLMAAGYDPIWGDDARGALFLNFNKTQHHLDTIIVINEY